MDILTRLGISAALAAMVVLTPAAHAQISPGELSQPHAFLEGMRKCLECHDLGEGPSDEKCLKCHKEIAAGIDGGRGYHFEINRRGKKECFECHSEHSGRDFQLVYWPNGINNFEHDQTGYKLVGKHSRLKCRDCHKRDYIKDDFAQYKDHVDEDRTFLGLDTACLDCHTDPHRGQFTSDCTTCHSNDGWRPTVGFDHQRSRYPLTGRHLELACAKCHPTVSSKDPTHPESESFVRYTGLAFDNCTPCHNDPHRGNYGATCAKCHKTATWHDVPPSQFDHAKTRFPLAGLHVGLVCDKCHLPGVKKTPLSHDRCADCHTDVHHGQFAARPDSGACEGCHTVNGFSPALFTTVDHAATRFALVGSHLAQPCFACHPAAQTADGKSYRIYRFDNHGCEACHRDVHYGQFSKGQPQKDCTACHGIDAWTPVAFDHARDSNYRLEGQHKRVPCDRCHVPATTGGVTFVRYKPIDASCKNCHSVIELESNPDLDEG